MNSRERFILKLAKNERGFRLSRPRPCLRTFRAALRLLARGLIVLEESEDEFIFSTPKASQ